MIRLQLPSALVNWIKGVPAPIDAIQPPEPEWEKELRRHRGLGEIQRGAVASFEEAKRRRELTICTESSPLRQTVTR